MQVIIDLKSGAIYARHSMGPSGIIGYLRFMSYPVGMFVLKSADEWDLSK